MKRLFINIDDIVDVDTSNDPKTAIPLNTWSFDLSQDEVGDYRTFIYISLRDGELLIHQDSLPNVKAIWKAFIPELEHTGDFKKELKVTLPNPLESWDDENDVPVDDATFVIDLEVYSGEVSFYGYSLPSKRSFHNFECEGIRVDTLVQINELLQRLEEVDF